MPIGFTTIANALPEAFVWVEISLSILILFWTGWLLLRRRTDVRTAAKRGLIALVLIQLTMYAVEYVWLIRDYQDHPVRKFLLPPYSPYMYELMIQSFVNLLVAWGLAGTVFLALAWLMRKWKQAELLNAGDLSLITLAVAAAGWPAGMIFLALIFVYTIVGMIGLVVLRKRALNDRLVISPFILPAAVTTILLKGYLLDWTQLKGIQI